LPSPIEGLPTLALNIPALDISALDISALDLVLALVNQYWRKPYALSILPSPIHLFSPSISGYKPEVKAFIGAT